MTDQVEHDLRKIRRAGVLLGIAFTILTLAAMTFVYWAFTGKDVLTIKETPVPVTSVVDKDGNVTLKISFCKLVQAEGRVVSKIVSDKAELLLPVYTDSAPKRCYENTSIKVPIPPQAVPGTYHINYRITYNTNPLHRGVIEEFNSAQFQVVDKE